MRERNSLSPVGTGLYWEFRTSKHLLCLGCRESTVCFSLAPIYFSVFTVLSINTSMSFRIVSLKTGTKNIETYDF